MPTWFDIILLSIVEGVTEYLPISSTGHMIIASNFLGLEKTPELSAFLVVVQAGAILAVFSVFFKDFKKWFLAWTKISEKTETLIEARSQSLAVACSVIPFALIGYTFKNQIKALFSIQVVSYALLAGGLLIIVTELFLRNRPSAKQVSSLGLKDSLLIGLGQCCALWPGFSRSAATILTGRMLGYSRSAAAEVSFLVGTPALLGTALYEAMKEWHNLTGIWHAYLAVGIVISWAVAYVCVKGFVKYLQKFSLLPFAYYRILVAFVLIWIQSRG